MGLPRARRAAPGVGAEPGQSPARRRQQFDQTEAPERYEVVGADRASGGVDIMTPHLVAPWFGGANYRRMADVLAYTAAIHCPHWQRTIERIAPPKLSKHPSASESHLCNTQKMEAWYQAVAAAPDGACLLLIDADTFITRSEERRVGK